MTDFLLAGIPTKSRARHALQLRQMRMLKQLSELHQVLGTLESELGRIERLIESKSTEVESLQRKRQESTHEYATCRQQFAEFTQRIAALEEQLATLQDDLFKVETIRDFKTSPDVTDEFYDRPTSIKLSLSLQRRLVQRRRTTLQPLVPEA